MVGLHACRVWKYIDFRCFLFSVILSMVLKPDQQRIKDLLSETITLLCRSGLHFKSEFSIEALIGITLDQEDVFLVSIKETVHTADETRKRSDSWVDHSGIDSHRAHSTSARHHGAKEHGVADLRTRRQSDFALDERLILNPDGSKHPSSFVNSSCQKLMPEPMRHLNHKRLRKDPAPKSYAQGEALCIEVDGDELIVVEQKSKRQRLDGSGESTSVSNKASASKVSSEYPNGDAECLNKPCSSVKSFVEINSGADDITSAIVPESEGNSLQNAEGYSLAAECNGANVHSESDAEKVCDVTNAGSDNDECFKKEFLKIKDEPKDDSWSVSRQAMRHLYGQLTSGRALSGRKYGSRGSTVGIMHPLAIQQVEPGICSLWQASATQESTTGLGSSLPQWMPSGVVDPSNSETEVSSRYSCKKNYYVFYYTLWGSTFITLIYVLDNYYFPQSTIV